MSVYQQVFDLIKDSPYSTKDRREQMKEALEAILDLSTGMASVTEMLSEIARAKAEHVGFAWQDEALKEDWDHDAAELERLDLYS